MLKRSPILILDNHDSHISIETIDLSKENGVTLLMLLPHCSHKLQPLDRSVYGPFKTFIIKLQILLWLVILVRLSPFMMWQSKLAKQTSKH